MKYKHCTGCRFYKSPTSNGRCLSPDVLKYYEEPVKGIPSFVFATEGRGAPESCGTDGKYWEPRPSKKLGPLRWSFYFWRALLKNEDFNE